MPSNTWLRIIGMLLVQLLFCALIDSLTSKITWTNKLPRANDVCAGHNMGEFVANPYECSKFYYCLENGEGAEAECPHGMLFNRNSKLCDQKSNVDCDLTTPNGANNSELAAVERFCATQAIQQNGRVEYVSSASSCRHYYICYYGQAIRQECASNLHWNANSKKCDFAENAGCRVGNTGAQNGNGHNNNVVDQLINCPAFGQHVFPHMRRCDFFVYCVKGHAILQQCPFYFEFDVDTKTCKSRNLARCVTNMLS